MSDKDTGEPAFPRVPFDVNDFTGDGSPGMSLRNWFAGMALQGLLAGGKANSGTSKIDYAIVAKIAIEQADAMIEAGK